MLLSSKNLQFILLVIFFAVVTQYFWKLFAGPEFFNQPIFTEDVEANTGLALRDIYRQIHNLEAISRNEVLRHNSGWHSSGGQHNTSRERFVLEEISKEIARLKQAAQVYIAQHRAPVQRQGYPPIGYGYTDYWGERILGIPSVPGNIHSYHMNPLYETNRIPKEQSHAEDMHTV